MPHIDGHVITPPKSCGVLKMRASKVEMFLLPNSWTMTKDNVVGFLPMTMEGLGVNTVIAQHVYLKEDYDSVERIYEKKFPVVKLEQLPLYPPLLARVKKELPKHLDTKGRKIFKIILTYFGSNDFKKFYLKPASLVSTTTLNPGAGKKVPKVLLALLIKSGPHTGYDASTQNAIDKIHSIMH